MNQVGALSVRMARPEDAVAIAPVHVASWRDTYPGLIPEDFLLRRLSVPRSAAQWQAALLRPGSGHATLVAEVSAGDGGSTPVASAVVGFASAGPARQRGSFAGELYALYVLPDYQGDGLGRLLVNRIAQRLLGNGIDSMYVEVLEGNPSRFFYEAMKGVRLAQRDLQFAGTRLPVVLYGWTDLIALASDLPRHRRPIDSHD